jgi:S-adenosylmethionine-dependent methyltransferase
MFYNANGLSDAQHGGRETSDLRAVGDAENVKNGRFRLTNPLRARSRFTGGWRRSGWRIASRTGVRVFHDYLREKQQQRELL